ncbi:hypothetical protein IJT10_02705, partial [bacterium]|nr:hypothetical protein [bacterium]
HMVEAVPLLHGVAWERIWEEMHTILEQKIGESEDLWRKSNVLNFFGVNYSDEAFSIIHAIEEADASGWSFWPLSAEKLHVWLHEKIEGDWCRLSILKLFFLLHDFWNGAGDKKKLPSYIYSSLIRMFEGRVGELIAKKGSLEEWHLLLYRSKTFPLEALAAHFQDIDSEGKYFYESKERGRLYLDHLVSDYLEQGPLSDPVLPIGGMELCEELHLDSSPRIGYLLEKLRIASLDRNFSKEEALAFASDLIKGF